MPQKCYCWHLSNREADEAEQQYKREGHHVSSTIQQGYCPHCGYNFNLTVLNIDTEDSWLFANMSCPKCGSIGKAGQYAHQHRLMQLKARGCIILLALLAIVTFCIIKLCY